MAATARPSADALRRHRGDLFGVLWVLCFALLFLSPALKDGPQFAPADLGAQNSPITAGALALETDCLATPPAVAPATCPHDDVNGDEITQAIPWNTTNWKLVHAGEFPWWNDLEGNGLPQFLNFESGTLALPSLVGYLAPLAESFLVTVLMKLLIAGMGTYVLCRLLGCRPVAAATGGVGFMLSGSFAGWIGWSLSGTLCWAGAIAAAGLCCYRRRGGGWATLALALSVAFAIYGGFVEAYALLAGIFAVLAAAGLLGALAAGRRPSPWGLVRVLGAGAAGVALAAPLWLTGASLLHASIRSGEVAARGLTLHGAALLFAQGYDGLPIAGSTFFGVGLPNYFESAAYVGVLTLVLAGVCLLVAPRRPATIGFTAAAVAAFLLAYRLGPVSPVQRLVIDLGLGAIDVSRVLPLLAFSLAVLGAMGAELLIARAADRTLRRALGASVAVVGLVLVVLGVKALGGLGAPELALRQASLYWPVATLVLFAVVALLAFGKLGPRRLLGLAAGPALGAFALVAESAFLLFAGVGINSYAVTAFPVTPAVALLQHLGSSPLIALDDQASASCFRVGPTGFYPNENVGYGIDELAVHDPIAPAAYFNSWPVAGVGQAPSATCPGVNVFAPAVSSAALARRYGASFILADSSVPPPAGTHKVIAVGPDTLYALPPSANTTSPRFTLTGADSVTAVSHPGDASYRLNVVAPDEGTLTARITKVPGWRATVDGRPVTVGTALGTFLSVPVAAGATEITLTYRPPHLAVALALALLGALGLAAFALAPLRRRSSGRVHHEG